MNIKYFNPNAEEDQLQVSPVSWYSSPIVLFVSLMILWFYMPLLLNGIDKTAGGVDQGIWLVILISLISFLMVCALCWWLLQRFWMILQLPSLELMVSKFKYLPLWQQLIFFYASFALLLLAALGCLIAIC
ncbi:hypothetical protein ACSBL2_17160 [Pedobacter sp. AW31-3R]|uniref:hypothetical protein n=1 Tax=Pedobacter sp. AW31-3R TaxID=3445781 RepID=UPI003F9F663E